MAYASLPTINDKYPRVLPCLDSKGVGCDKAEYPTDKELAEAVAEADRAFENVLIARKAIVDAIGPWKREVSESGRIHCPICKKKAGLAYSRSGYNGHIHGKCDTDGCLNWME